MARSHKEPTPKYPTVKSEIRRQENAWWIRCPKDEWIEYSTCHKTFMNANALKLKEHHCFNCHNGKEYRIKFANGTFDKSFYDMLYPEKIAEKESQSRNAAIDDVIGDE